MRETFLPFTRPSITESEIREVSETLRSGWITSGPRVAARIVSLPLFPDMQEEDVIEVVEATREILHERKR